MLDIYAALPSITGKLELEYEGELKGGDAVAPGIDPAGGGQGLTPLFRRRNMQPIVQWFELGGIVEAGRDRVVRPQMVQQFGANSGSDGEDGRAGSGRE